MQHSHKAQSTALATLLVSDYSPKSTNKVAASIRGAIAFQAVTTRFSTEVLLDEAVEGCLDREPAVDVVHVVEDDQIMKLRRRQR